MGLLLCTAGTADSQTGGRFGPERLARKVRVLRALLNLCLTRVYSYTFSKLIGTLPPTTLELEESTGARMFQPGMVLWGVGLQQDESPVLLLLHRGLRDLG